MGNDNDVLIERLADQGDGFYAYVDTLDEAERIFNEELTGTSLTVAKNAKVRASSIHLRVRNTGWAPGPGHADLRTGG